MDELSLHGKTGKARLILREVETIPENPDERKVEHFQITKVKNLEYQKIEDSFDEPMVL